MNAKEKQQLNSFVRLTSWWIKEWKESLVIPNKDTLNFLSKNLGIPISDFLLFFKDRNASNHTEKSEKRSSLIDMTEKGKILQKNTPGTHDFSINDPAIKEFVTIWTSMTKHQLSLSDKLEIGTLVKNHPSDIIPALNRWIEYQNEFEKVTLVERAMSYLFGSKFANFVSNIEKFLDENTFRCYFEQHKKRLERTKGNVSNYGFSLNPIEDRRLAEEFEKENIAFSFASDFPYVQAITFPANKEYYDKMMKKINRRKK